MELAYQDEREIVDLAKNLENSQVCFYPVETERSHRVLASLRGESLAKRERPDFEDPENSLLLEAMIVDDHPRPGNKDRTRAREGAVLRELRGAGFAETFPNASLVAIVNSGLPTDEDHNYDAYLSHFTSVVDKHSRNVEIYRAQRPGFDLGFLIFDESTAYVETLGSIGPNVRGRAHFHFADEAFVSVIRNAGIDCVAWLTPYKHFNAEEQWHSLPQLTIMDVHQMDEDHHDNFDARRMMSTEE